ncbi:MAG: hypothetical protein GWN18_01395, partial [Thermoplasmata archaeon]|nr:hypothetical protein [Thermoplasmata archaeon]NIS10652.1 hypothetical protein [Thermoplasmata archaeon]NIS18611.1 hypothetical protein [Thermoplasmata archaeon]NIT75602.1 hypothetical protein [Thermoplasmata archaeon]NIU47764.1 hypothetical protein [Thermoplasmata archaeon]
DGDTVVVYNGDYDENIRIGKRITLMGTDQRTVVLRNSNGNSVITVSSSQVTISNLRIEGSMARVGIYAHDVTGLSVRKVAFTGCEKGIMLEMGHHLTVAHCTFRNSHTSGLYVSGNDAERFENIDIRDCTFSDNKANAILLNRCRHVMMDRLTMTGSGHDGINAYKVAWVQLRNSTISDNRNGLMLFDSHGWDIEDNVIQGNRHNGIELNQSGAEIPNELHRNQISRNSQGQGISAAGILFFGKGAADNIVANNDIAENPTGLNFISYSGGCNYNTFRRNVVRKCDYGIWESSGTGPNTYLLNDFLYNSVQAAAVNRMSTFDDGHMGNYWSDYQTKVPSAIKVGSLWSAPYQVVSGVGAYDDYPLAYRYEQDPPVIQHLGPLEGEVLTPGMSATFGVIASDGSHIEGYTWSVKTPDGFESSYELA